MTSPNSAINDPGPAAAAASSAVVSTAPATGSLGFDGADIATARHYAEASRALSTQRAYAGY